MARGYAQSRSEGGAKDSNYVRSANVPQDDRFKASLAELLKEGYVTPKAKELVDKYGSGEVMDDEIVDFDSAKSPNLKRGNFMRSSVRGPEEKEVTKNKEGWTVAESETVMTRTGSAQGDIQVPITYIYKKIGEDIYFKETPSSSRKDDFQETLDYPWPLNKFNAKELAENGGRFKDIREAIDWTRAARMIGNNESDKAWQRWVESGGTLD